MKVLAILMMLFTAACSAPATSPETPPPSSAAASTAPVSGSAVTSATPASSAASDLGRYGYVVASAGRITVRRERSSDAVLAIGGENPVASHDGRRFAVWRTGPQGNNGQQLRIVDVPSGAERLVTTIPLGQGGGVIAWANDDTGLLYETHSTAQPATPRPPGGPDNSTLIAFDLTATQAPGSTASELMLSGGLVFIPLAWDKAGKMASALTTGEGGYAVHYYVWDMKVQPAGVSPTKRTQFPWSVPSFYVRASYDAKRAVAIDGTAHVLRVWPIGDIGASDSISPVGFASITDVSWRPVSSADIAWVQETTVIVFTYQTSALSTIYRGSGQANVSILAWRADGSGILLRDGTRFFVIELPSSSATDVSGFTNVARVEPVVLR